MNVFTFFIKYLFSARAGAVVKKISWLSIVAVTLSVASLVIVISVMLGLNKNIKDRTLSIEPTLNVVLKGAKNMNLVLSHPAYVKFKIDGPMKVFPSSRQDVILRTVDGRFRGAIGRGLTAEGFDHIFSTVLPGLQSAIKSADLEPGEAVLGSDLAYALGLYEGNSVSVISPESLLLPSDELPKIEKVIVKKIVSTSIADVDANYFFYIDGKTLGQFKNEASQKYGFEVWAPNEDMASELKRGLENYPELQAETWQERNSALFLSLKIEKFVIGVFLTIAALIASFSILSVEALLISQKRKEISVLRFLGYSVAQLKNLFFQIGALLGVIGIGVGVLIGFCVSYYMELYPLKVLPDIYYDSDIPAQTSAAFILGVLFIGLLVCVIGCYFVSKSIKDNSISQSLR